MDGQLEFTLKAPRPGALSVTQFVRSVRETLELNLTDDVSTWALGPTGKWHRVPRVRGISTQKRLQELAVGRSRKRRSSEMHG